MFVRAVNTGSLAWALALAFSYFYMVSAWGGYVFIINLVPLYVLVLLVTGRYSQRLYVAYNCMYVLGTLLAIQIRFWTPACTARGAHDRHGSLLPVIDLQEFYADFCAIDQYHFTLNIPNNHIYMLPTVVDPPGMQSLCDQAVDGIASVFLALKRRPVIRYQRTSDVAKRIVRETAANAFFMIGRGE